MPTENPAAKDAPANTATDDAAYQAGLAARLRGETPPEDGEDKPAAAEGEDKPAGDDTDAADDQVDDDAEAEGEDDEGKEGEDEEDAEADADEEGEVDKEALRKLAKEKRSFEQYKAGVLQLERTVKEREQRVEKGERELSEFFGQLNGNPVETLLRHNMIPEADFKFWAQQFHLLSPEGLKDPRSKPEAERLRRERDRDLEARRATQRVENLERERAAEKAQAEQDRQTSNYVARIEQSVPVFKAKTPLLTKAMTADPATTKRELYAVAYELAQANNGQYADPGKVVLEWEKQQRERLARLGLSPPTSPPATKTKEKSPTAAKNQGQGQKKNGAPAAAEPAVDPDIAKSDDEYHAELQRRLRQK